MNDESLGFFDPAVPVDQLTGNLPHWRQGGVTYFVTFRLADSIPQEKLRVWSEEMKTWLREHPEPHDEPARRDFFERFPRRFQKWLDAGYGSCVLLIPEVSNIVHTALRHFHEKRYALDVFAIAANHVHVLVAPVQGQPLSNILHSWKSYTAHEIVKVEAASRRLNEFNRSTRTVWQKESFDHIVRSPESLEKFRQYIREHRHGESMQSGGTPLLH